MPPDLSPLHERDDPLAHHALLAANWRHHMDRILAKHRTESGITRVERRYLCGGSAAHADAVSRYHRATRRFSRALCAMAVLDYEADLAADREEAREEALLAREDEIASATGPMRLWRVERPDEGGYDTYSDFIVAAVTAEQAARVHPSAKYTRWDKASQRFVSRYDGTPTEEWGSWTDDVDGLKVACIGMAIDGMEHGTVLCASFHAG